MDYNCVVIIVIIIIIIIIIVIVSYDVTLFIMLQLSAYKLAD